MRKGFTLIELVMVIVILGILAATALPRFVGLQTEARESAAKGALGGIRAAVAIEYARSAAQDGAAAYPTAAIVNGGTLFADGQVPANPYTGTNVVLAPAAVPPVAVVDGAAWLYDAATGRVWINDVAHFDW